MSAFNIKPIIDENLEPAINLISGKIDDIESGKNDPSAFFEEDAIDAISLIYECAPAEYQRVRVNLKKNNIQISALEKLIDRNVGKFNKQNPADELVNLVNMELELFHNEENKAFATICIKGHYETYPILYRSFSEWLAAKQYSETGSCPNELTIRTAQQALSGKARFDGKELQVFLRVANYEDGHIIDIGCPEWKAIFVRPNSWKTIDHPPVKFWRNENMRPLPRPLKRAKLDCFWELLNIPTKDKIFILTFIFECWRNNTMFPILELIGEQGTAKSHTQSVLRTFIDPNKVALRAAPKTVEDLFVSASQNWLASYNNLSHLRPEMQDAFCSLSTGGGYSARKLYTNNEESVIDISRPCILNGIGGIATAQDLLDRVIRIELQPIEINRPVSELNKLLDESKSEIFGALLNRFSKALAYLPEARKKPINDRMADFVMLGEAVLLSYNKKASFAKLYEAKKTRAATQAIESSPAILSIVKIASKSPYHGTYSKLLERLKYNYPSPYLPKSPKGLADLLKRQAPALRRIGIDIIHHNKRKNDGYYVSIEKKVN